MKNYKQKIIDTIAKDAIKQGYRVFIAKGGTYGFYCDMEGARLVGFQCEGLRLSFSGKYKSNFSGNGWGISDSYNSRFDLDKFINSSAPAWAIAGDVWEYTNLKQHLDFYGKSSGYSEKFLNLNNNLF